MNFLLIRNTTLLSIALLILTGPPLSGIRLVHAQDDPRQIAELNAVLRTGSDEEKFRAVMQLSMIQSEKASELMLKTLKNNLVNKRGLYVKYAPSTTIGEVVFWASSSSENGVLVRALAGRKYERALPTLRKMLKMKEKWVGLSTQSVALSIYEISSQPVKYVYDGELKIYPEPEWKADGTVIIGSLRMPATGETSWPKDGLNSRIRKLVLVLESTGGAEGNRDPFYRTLKEDVGLSTLTSLAKGGDPLVRPYAVEALGILGENLAETIPLLTAAVRDQDPRVRFRCVRALGHLLGSKINDEEATAVVSGLKVALSDADAEVRVTAAEQFGMHPGGYGANTVGVMKGVVPLLVLSLDDKVVDVRSGAAFALGRLGSLTEEVVPPLIRLLMSPEEDDRQRAAQALGDISSGNYTPSEENQRLTKEIGRALVAAADDQAKSVRYAAAEGLGEIGPVVRGVIPALIKLTKDGSRGVRTAAAASLGMFKTERTRIVPGLTRMLKVEEEDDQVIGTALSSLGELGPDAHSAATEVKKLVKHKNSRIRELARDTLQKIEDLPVPKATQ